MTDMRIEKQCCHGLVLVLWLAVSAGAHIGDRVYPVSYLSDEMLEQIDLKDGSVDDWQELIGEPSMTLLDFRSLGDLVELDPSNLDFRIWLAWHDDPARFYVAFVASDDIYKNDHDYHVSDTSVRDSMDLNDSISLVIDGDHGGGPGCGNVCLEEEGAEIRNRSQKYDAIARTPDGPNLDDPWTRHATGELAWTVLPPYGDSGGGVFGENPAISVIELYVTPFDRWAYDDVEGSVASGLDAGKVIGFGIVVFDSDPPEYDEVAWPFLEATQPVDHIDAIDHLRADGYLDGLLLPPADAEPGDSAVESVSWGRIKASLEM